MSRKPVDPVEPRRWSPLLTVEEVAERLQVPKQTIYYWRSRGSGPCGRIIGRHVRYREDDLIAWIDKQPTVTT